MKKRATHPTSTKNAQAVSWPEVLREAQQRFGIKRFRPGQREVLESVFSGKNTLALMPTGAGKSLTYQLPALFLPKPVVVVSPLIALMQDQQQKAQDAEVTVEKLDSTISKGERERAKEEIADGVAQLIYVTPEKLTNPEFLAELNRAGGISLLVIDEAHTIPQWGHDFRPAFLAIGEARRSLGNPSVLALTATATPQVAHDILHSLHAEDATVINTGIERDNLFFAVHPTVNNQAKIARIRTLIEKEQGTGIIYTASVRSANELYEFLCDSGVSVARYHGRMTAREREHAQQDFMRGGHKVMIATKAFGLGIDKPDIRFVYHFEFPDSVETYYQEAGRAGRDGQSASAVLLYRLEDKRIQNFFLAGRYPKLAELQAVYDAIAGSLPDAAESDKPVTIGLRTAEGVKISQRRIQAILNLLRESGFVRKVRRGYVLAPGEASSHAKLESILQAGIDRAASDKDRLAEMMHYAETGGCRMQAIRAYFEEPEGEPCLRCDNCARDHKDVAPSTRDRGRTTEEETVVPARHENVTTIETMHGTIQTTAPETLPDLQPTSPFEVGGHARHQRFGTGKILDVFNDTVLITFPGSGQKRLRADFLTAV